MSNKHTGSCWASACWHMTVNTHLCLGSMSTRTSALCRGIFGTTPSSMRQLYWSGSSIAPRTDYLKPSKYFHHPFAICTYRKPFLCHHALPAPHWPECPTLLQKEIFNDEKATSIIFRALSRGRSTETFKVPCGKKGIPTKSLAPNFPHWRNQMLAKLGPWPPPVMPFALRPIHWSPMVLAHCREVRGRESTI